MSQDDSDRTVIVRLWMEAREIGGLPGELRSSLGVVGEDERTQARGITATREVADQLLVRIATEMGGQVDGKPGDGQIGEGVD